MNAANSNTTYVDEDIDTKTLIKQLIDEAQAIKIFPTDKVDFINPDPSDINYWVGDQSLIAGTDRYDHSDFLTGIEE